MFEWIGLKKQEVEEAFRLKGEIWDRMEWEHGTTRHHIYWAGRVRIAVEGIE